MSDTNQNALVPNHCADGTKVMALTISRTTREMPMQIKQNVRNCLKLGNSLMLRSVVLVFTGDAQRRLTKKAEPRRNCDMA
jgi:hypothetical protein